jgi:chromosome segregation ATPase
VVQRLDRKAIRKSLDEAIAEKERRLRELDDEIKNVREAIEGERIRILERKLQALEHERLNVEGEASGVIHSLQKRLSRDAESNTKLMARLEQVDLAIHRQAEAIRNTRYENPNRANDAAQRLQALFTARQRLSEASIAVDPFAEIDRIIRTHQIEE